MFEVVQDNAPDRMFAGICRMLQLWCHPSYLIWGRGAGRKKEKEPNAMQVDVRLCSLVVTEMFHACNYVCALFCVLCKVTYVCLRQRI